MLSKFDFTRRFMLLRKQEWLRRRADKLNHTLAFCRNGDERDLLYTLLNRFTFLENAEADELLQQVFLHVSNVWKLKQDETLFSAAAFDKESDGSQVFLYLLRPVFARNRWHGVKTYSRLGASFSPMASGRYRNLVIVDDFSGTGRTLIDRVRDTEQGIQSLQRMAPQSRSYTIRICLLAGMEAAVRNIQSEKIEIFCPLQLKKGISDHSDSEHRAAAIKCMSGLEGYLAQEYRGRQLPNLGDGMAEALYSKDSMNTPNSVFPIFWWPHLPSGEHRITLLDRDENRQ